MADYFIPEYNAAITKRYKDNETILETARQFNKVFQNAVLSSEGTFTLEEPSFLSDYKDCEGNNFLCWNGKGFKTILDVLIKTYPDESKELPFYEKLILNNTVKKILWQGNENAKVVVQFIDGSTINTDFVIFTPSLGVLKHDHETLFQPPLPINKVEVIEQLGISAVFKIALHFTVKWWPDDFSTLLVWLDDDKQDLHKDFPEPQLNGVSWATNFFTFSQAPNNPNVLIGWIVGPQIPEIEKLGEGVFKNASWVVLNQFLGLKYNVTKPDKIIWSNWYTNPNFRGTYSYETTKSRARPEPARVELSEPLLDEDSKPIVLFAGEATSRYYAGTVHGAIGTGFREADRIIKFDKK